MTARFSVRRAWRGARHRQLVRSLAGPKLLRAFADAYPHAFFVEIGSNDGEQHDHLRPFILDCPWRGIMVEPVPYVFERLRRNYESHGRIVLENVAIAERDGELPFYHLREAAPRGASPRYPTGTTGSDRSRAKRSGSHVKDIPDVERADRLPRGRGA